jgi:TRAP-type C4-dicarboxylate transport system permease small subunit
MKKLLRGIYKGIQMGEIIICLLGLIVTTLLICAQIVNRYWLRFEIMWMNDLALYTFMFFMFMAFSATTWKEGHVPVEVFKNMVFKNRPVEGAVYRVFLVILSIVILLAIFPVTYQFTARAIQYPEYATLVRWLNTSWLMIILFVAFCLTLLHLLVILVRDVKVMVKTTRLNRRRG